MTTSMVRIAQVCPLCSGDMSPHTREVHDPISGEQFSIVWCPACGMGATSPVPRRIEAYYRERYYGNRHSFTGRLCNWRRRRLVSRCISPHNGARLLDVGCGDGAFLEAARLDGWSTVGVEPHGAHGDGEYPVFATVEEAASRAPYDCITLWHVLEHVPDPLETLTQLRSMLSREGALVFAVPDFGGLQARIFGRHWLHLDVPRHLYHFSAQSLTCLLDAAGFDVLHTAHQELEYDWFGWIQSSLNAVSRTPNVLFDALTGKPPRVGRMKVGASYAAGSLLALAGLGLTAASTLCRLGGTIIVSARPRSH
jgi:Methyltransferase domain